MLHPSGKSANRLRFLSFALLAISSFQALPAPEGAPDRQTELSGELAVLIGDDFASNRTTSDYFLRESVSGRLVKLSLTREQKRQLRPGQRLRIRGYESGARFIVDEQSGGIVRLAATQAAAVPSVTRRVVTLIVDITDGSGSVYRVDPSCDGSSQLAADNMFGSLTGKQNADGCFREGSYEALGFGGGSYPGNASDVFRVSIVEPAPSLVGVCNWHPWATAADAAATQLGVNLNQYQHRMYILPKETDCWWAGLAFLNCGDSCQAWNRAYSHHQCGYPDTLAHELGHNVGMMHAQLDSNDDGISDCEYCDISDVMGYAQGFWRTFNAPHRIWMGWLPPSNILSDPEGGIYQISALELSDAPFPQAVRIDTSTGRTYWVSYRAPIGYDANLKDYTGYSERIHVHRLDENGNSLLLTALAEGQEYQYDAGAFKIKELSHDSESAVFYAQVDDECVRDLIPGSMTPFERAANSLPATRRFALTLQNPGAAACGVAGATISAIVPGGWIGNVSSTSAALDPSESQDVQLTVTAPVGTADGAYSVAISTSGASSGLTSISKGVVFIDTVPPQIAVSRPEVGASYAQNLSLAAHYECTDATTEVTECIGPVASGDQFDTQTLGQKSFVVSAKDRAGNVKTISVNYTVVARSPAFSLTPAKLDFGSQPVGVQSTGKYATFKNTGNVPIKVNAATITGANAGQFALQNYCPEDLYIDESCTLAINFLPTSSGAKSAKLDVQGGATTKSVTLVGTGTTAKASIALAPSSLSFGSVSKGSTSAPKIVTVTNTGTKAAGIASVSLTGTNANQFVRSNNCPTQLGVGASCSISITFKPTTKGSKTASLKVKPVGGTAKTVALSGTGR